MVNIPYEQLAEKIIESGKISKEELDVKVTQKLEQLTGLISKNGAAHIIANELGVKIFDAGEIKDVKVSKLLAGMKNVDIFGKVVAVFDIREFSTDKSSGKVGSFIIGDETGTVRITCWHEQTDKMEGLEKGDILKITNGYVRENNGRVEIHLNDNSTIEKNPEGVVIEDVKPSVALRKKIADLTDKDSNVEILGTIVQSYSPNFFEVCPECGKRARAKDDGHSCSQHGMVTPTYSYVMNAFIDDGSQNMRLVCFRDQVQELLGKTHEEVLVLKDAPEAFEELKYGLLGHIIKATGRVTRNEMFDRLEFVSNSIVKDPDAQEELDKVKNLEE